jgi:hypothetical protein
LFSQSVSGNYTLDANNGAFQALTATANININGVVNVGSVPNAMDVLTIYICQDSVGGHSINTTSGFLSATLSGVVMPTTPNACILIPLVWKSSTFILNGFPINFDASGHPALPSTTTIPLGTPTFTSLGTGVTSVTCTTGYTCSNQSGNITIVGGTFTTGTMFTFNFSTTLPNAPVTVIFTQSGGATGVAIGHGTVSASGTSVNSISTIAGQTISVDYHTFQQ